MKFRALGSHDESAEAYGRACNLFIDAGSIQKAVECQEAMGNTLAAAGNYVV
jgi:hypothetical protein